MALNPKLNKLLDKAKQNGYLSHGGGNTINLQNIFYQWCKENGSPIVRISKGSKYAEVSIDMSTTETILNEDAQSKIKSLFLPYTEKGGSVGCSAYRCSFDKVPIGKTDELAKKLILIYASGKHKNDNES